MVDVSPTKWHLAHTSWFWETFLLAPYLEGYEPLDPRYAYLFNSYYLQAGERHCRAQRGYLSRPTVAQVGEYRAHVDAAMEALLPRMEGEPDRRYLVELGLNHEQQHQELLLTDIKHVFSVNPLRPSYKEVTGWGKSGSGSEIGGGPSHPVSPADPGPRRWVEFSGGIQRIGHEGTGFAYDNEGPSHRVFLEPYALANRLVTCGDYLEFMADGGYTRPELWLSEGWAMVKEREWSEPFYWEERDGEWWLFTLQGMKAVDRSEPVCHLTYFEADAYARWAGARLPTEFEWEAAARPYSIQGNTLEAGEIQPRPLHGYVGDSDEGGRQVEQLFGDVWEWTGSHYSPYPGFRPAEGAVGEYNGKFMANQFVLRGGSCVTSASHLRSTYRNFFPADTAWQFSGVRLARDLLG
jgi:ergothioneine biosynthesis protein EgtB